MPRQCTTSRSATCTPTSSATRLKRPCWCIMTNAPTGITLRFKVWVMGRTGAAGLFLNSESARIANPFYVTHNGKYLWSVSHPQYTDAVVNLYNTWAVKNGMKTIRSMSNEQAMLFLQAIEGSESDHSRLSWGRASEYFVYVAEGYGD